MNFQFLIKQQLKANEHQKCKLNYKLNYNFYICFFYSKSMLNILFQRYSLDLLKNMNDLIEIESFFHNFLYFRF